MFKELLFLLILFIYIDTTGILCFYKHSNFVFFKWGKEYLKKCSQKVKCIKHTLKETKKTFLKDISYGRKYRLKRTVTGEMAEPFPQNIEIWHFLSHLCKIFSFQKKKIDRKILNTMQICFLGEKRHRNCISSLAMAN